MTYVALDAIFLGCMLGFEMTASAGDAKVISMLNGAISTGHSFPQFIIPKALGVNKTVAVSTTAQALGRVIRIY